MVLNDIIAIIYGCCITKNNFEASFMVMI